MQKATVMKGSGLKSLEDEKAAEVTHVFGKNLEERVVNNDEEESPSISSFNIVSETKSPEEDDIDAIRKRKFDAITGEEDEETIFQSDFKLFVWDLPTSNWIEKGRGQLKLNDSIGCQEKKSRIIMRVSGTLRIILNVAVNRSFFRVIANSKTNLRFTDSQTVWAASGSNVNQLRDLIEERLKMTAEEESELRKKSKSDTDDRAGATPKKTKPDEEESTEPSPTKTSEIDSNETDKSDTTPPIYDDPGEEKEEQVASDEEKKDEASEHEDNESPKREDKNNTKPTEDGDKKISIPVERRDEETTTTTIANGEKS